MSKMLVLYHSLPKEMAAVSPVQTNWPSPVFRGGMWPKLPKS